jgi:hypothetical protein
MSLAALAIGTCHASTLISLSFSGAMTPIQQQTFMDAAAYWNSVITGYDLIYNGDGVVEPHGLMITASIPYIDGVGQILGSAGPKSATYYDNNPVSLPTIALHYASTGVMEFDSADVAALVGANQFYGVVLHEMAHVLGFGTLWTPNNNVNGTTYALYATGSGRYTGPHALAEWKTEFSQSAATFVPVELGGGTGTANGHWNENDGGGGSTGIVSASNGMDFASELMTGWASNTFFVSRTTLGALDDLGYVVDYSKAGVVSHLVVPEGSSWMLCLAAMPWALLRRRR